MGRLKIQLLLCIAALMAWIGGKTAVTAGAESLNWDLEDREDSTCIYGEVTVFDTVQGMSYCAVNFDHGYVCIQHLQEKDVHTAIFSIANTSAQLKAKIVKHGPSVKPAHVEGESEEVHLNLDSSWKLGKTFQFFLQKQPGAQAKTTDTSFYVADHTSGKWRLVGTINAANGPEHEQEVFGGISSWIENNGGEANAKKAKVVLYDLWVGHTIDGMRHLTQSGGESNGAKEAWGQLHDQYFLAEGGEKELSAAFSKLESKYGKPVFGKDGNELPHTPEKPVPPEVIKELKNLAR
jgi:hypothetical protein